MLKVRFDFPGSQFETRRTGFYFHHPLCGLGEVSTSPVLQPLCLRVSRCSSKSKTLHSSDMARTL